MSTGNSFNSVKPLTLALAILLLGMLIACGGPSTPGPTPTPAPSSNAIVISFYTSGTKADWVRDVTKTFNDAQLKTPSGKPVWVQVEEVDSGDFLPRLQDGRIAEPTVWSPGEISWVNEANVVWQQRYNKPLVSGECVPTVYAIIGIGMWKPMAEAMGWPDKPIGWDQIVQLAADPQGWARYDHAEWGQFKFGHTHPRYSNTGFLALTSLVYNTLDRTDGLTPEMVKSDQVVEAMRQVELHTYHYGTSTRGLFTLMAEKGPAYLHAGTNSEPGVFATNKFNKDTLRFPLVFIIPADGAFWSENPYCVIDGEWVSAEQREAAQVYKDYLLAREQQDKAMDFGLRPTDPDVPLRAPMTADWTDIHASPQTIPPLASVSGETAQAIQDVFMEVKKKATVVIILDTSGSMQGDKIKNATEATANFLRRLYRDDEILVFEFNTSLNALQPSGRAGDVAETLGGQVRGLSAGGSTALYDAVCAAVQRSNDLRAAHERENEKRLHGVVVLSDGQNTAGSTTKDGMFNCLPTGEDVEGVKVFTIAYGDDADKDLLKEIAARTNGRTFSGDPATIEQVYLAISAEQ
ncbi:MAG TPA: VWA domain-containing protein [Anaerolineae bacterium]|nr:VWA domain-containing protein [Anaerolineae bacterium]